MSAATPLSPPPAGFQAGNDIYRYLNLFRRRKWSVAATVLVVLTVVGAWVYRQPRIYSSSVSVIIDATAPRFLDAQVQEVTDTGAGNYWYNREYVETQFKVITSRAVAQRVVQKLSLHSDPAFLGVERIKDPELRAKVMAAQDPAARLQGMIRLKPVKDSRIVLIGVEDLDGKRAALLANEVAEAYIQENLALKLKVSESASLWLEDRLSDLEDKSKSSELAVYDFKKQADMLTTSLEDRQSMISQRLNAYNAALTEVRTAMAGLKARVDTIAALQKESDGDDSAWAVAFPTETSPDGHVVVELRKSFLALKLECTDLRSRYLEQHPRLVACEERFASVKGDLFKELNRIAAAARSQLSEAAAREKNLAQLLEDTKAEAFVVNKKQIEFERIKRDADNNQRLYDLVLKRLKDIELSSMLRTSNVRVLDAARPSMIPVYPRTYSIMAVAAVLGLLAGLGVALLLEAADNTIVSQADVEERLGVSFLGFVPIVASPNAADPREIDLFVHRQPKSAMAECCRAIRTNLLFMTPDKPLKRILVSSSSPQEGKSTAVISLGIAMAQSGNRVLLVDTDMRRPRLHRAFGVANDVGVSSIVVGEGTVDQALKSTEVPNLFVLPCGPIPPNPAELLHTEAFQKLLADLSGRFDRIVLDSPPVGPVADAAVLATSVDGVVLVLRAGLTNRFLAQRTVRSLLDVKARLFGAILNHLDVRDPKYGDYYYAYQRYGYYYGEKDTKPAQ